MVKVDADVGVRDQMRELQTIIHDGSYPMSSGLRCGNFIVHHHRIERILRRCGAFIETFEQMGRANFIQPAGFLPDRNWLRCMATTGGSVSISSRQANGANTAFILQENCSANLCDPKMDYTLPRFGGTLCIKFDSGVAERVQQYSR